MTKPVTPEEKAARELRRVLAGAVVQTQPISRHTPARDTFDGACAALSNGDGDAPYEAAPTAAMLLVRMAEQLCAEFGVRATAEAFRNIGEDLEL